MTTDATLRLFEQAIQDRYELQDQIGEGGFSRVYRARQVTTGQLVAIKVLRLQEEDPRSDKSRLARFRREMRLCARLHHPHIVRLIDSGQVSERLVYSVFEFIPGETLGDALRSGGALQPREAIHLMLQVLDALSAAHRLGMVHRDLKPQNIMLTNTGARRNATVLDFGIGAVLQQSASEPVYTQVTVSREFLGTPAYSAPEQLRGEPPTLRADLFSWGLILLECLTGQRVMSGDSVSEILLKQLGGAPVPMPTALRASRIGRLLEQVLNKEVMERDVTAEGLLREVERLIQDGASSVSIAGLAAVPAPAPTSAPAGSTYSEELSLVGEKRPVTALSLRLSASSVTNAALSSEDYDGLLRAQQELCVEIANRYDAAVAGGMGDQVLLVFGYPYARENDTQRAARAAFEMLQETIRRSPRLLAERGLSLSVHAGIHAGTLVIDGGRGVRDVVGQTPSVAVTLGRLAEPGTVLASGAAWSVLRRRFVGTPQGKVTVSGMAQPLKLVRLSGATTLDTLSEPRAQMVGRAQEQALLLQRWQQAQAGAGQRVMITGDAGIGKSRLTVEIQRIAQQDGAWLIARCAPERQDIALWPIIDMLENLFGLDALSSPEERLKQLSDAVQRYGFEPEEAVPLFGELLSLPHGFPVPPSAPGERRAMLLNAVLALLFEIAEQQPLLLVVEDLHWSDPTTLEMLGMLIADIESSSMMALCTARPSFADPGWPGLLQVALGPLAPDKVIDLAGRLSTRELSAALLGQLAARTDGVPLFIEELIQALDEAGDQIVNLDDMTVPTTLRGSLTARLDRQGPAKETAQLASVLGREFSLRLLERISERAPNALRSDLQSLMAANLVSRRRRLRETTYLFRHALVRDTAYESMLQPTRQAIHGRVAQALEADAARPELLAYHCEAAGDHPRALQYLIAAAGAALQRSANMEALNLSSHGISLLDAIPDGRARSAAELGLNSVRMGALMATRGWSDEEVDRTVQRSLELVKEVDDSPFVEPTLLASLQYHHTRGLRAQARVLSDQLLEMFENAGDDGKVAALYGWHASALIADGDIDEAETYAVRSAELYDPQRDRHHAYAYSLDTFSYAYMGLSLIKWLQGYPDQAIEIAKRGYAHAQTIDHGSTMALAKIYVTLIHQSRRERALTGQSAEETLELTTQYRLMGQGAYAQLLKGWVHNDLPTMEQNLAGIKMFGFELALTYYSTLLVLVEIALGRPDAAMMRLDGLIQSAQDLGEVYYLPELLRLRGEILVGQGEVGAAEQHFREAVALARQKGARMLALRAATSLAQLIGDEQSRAAHAILKGIYDQFTEGFETQDLKDAAAALARLVPGDA
ncbi:MAG: TOMM system kinase/cyclase fusion protein [Myxococcota bacterium]